MVFWKIAVFIKYIFIKLLNFYQKYISFLSHGSCRYYPTCSEYAKWQVKHNLNWRGLLAIILRILRCNKFFAGGIDYPKVYKAFYKRSFICTEKMYKKKILYWFVPYKNGKYFVIKTF